ncbi:MAG: hypothetical protein MJY87_10625 [Fibrobacter sp.]|nr:hypothetical protein [Fibrobacter sp.]
MFQLIFPFLVEYPRVADIIALLFFIFFLLTWVIFVRFLLSKNKSAAIERNKAAYEILKSMESNEKICSFLNRIKTQEKWFDSSFVGSEIEKEAKATFGELNRLAFLCRKASGSDGVLAMSSPIMLTVFKNEQVRAYLKNVQIESRNSTFPPYGCLLKFAVENDFLQELD